MVLLYPGVAGERQTLALRADRLLQLLRFFVFLMVLALHRPDDRRQALWHMPHVDQAQGRRDEVFVATELADWGTRHPRHVVRDPGIAKASEDLMPVLTVLLWVLILNLTILLCN